MIFIRYLLLAIWFAGCSSAAFGQQLTKERPAGWLKKARKPSTGIISIGKRTPGGIPTAALRSRAEEISRLRLPYLFGGDTPSDGGMDCSGCIKHLLTSLGMPNVPRTSYQQYEWVKDRSRLKKTKTIDHEKLNPGDLIFWGGTYKSGHKVSHVMLYMGRGVDGKLYMFGARSKRLNGVGGAGVDIHELRPGQHKNLIGFGRIPTS